MESQFAVLQSGALCHVALQTGPLQHGALRFGVLQFGVLCLVALQPGPLQHGVPQLAIRQNKNLTHTLCFTAAEDLALQHSMTDGVL
jgi:hypothetical protein